MSQVFKSLGLILAVLGFAAACAFFPRFFAAVAMTFRPLRALFWVGLGLILFLFVRSLFRRSG